MKPQFIHNLENAGRSRKGASIFRKWATSGFDRLQTHNANRGGTQCGHYPASNKSLPNSGPGSGYKNTVRHAAYV